MNIKKILRICGCIIIIQGIILVLTGLMAGGWEHSRIEEMIHRGNWGAFIGTAMFKHIIYGILSIITGVGTLVLSKIAIYSLIPICLWGFWFQTYIHGGGIGIMLSVLYTGIIISTVIYLFRNQNS